MSDIDLKDLKLANELIVKLSDGGADIKGVSFNASSRKEDPSIDNRQILNWLKEGGRDFQSITEDESKEIEDVFIKEVERRFARLDESSIKNLKNTLNSILVSGLKKAILKLISIIHNHIVRGTVAGGGSVDALSPEYAKVKQRKYGFTHPIGVATGQLLDNLSPDVKNIKIIK